MGLVESKEDVYCTEIEDGGKVIPGLIIYRFDLSLVFFNADYFKDRVRTVINQANTKPAWFLFNAESVSLLHITGADSLEALRVELAEQDIVLAVARAKEWFRVMLERTDIVERIGAEYLFPTAHASAQSFLAAGQRSRNGASWPFMTGNQSRGGRMTERLSSRPSR